MRKYIPIVLIAIALSSFIAAAQTGFPKTFFPQQTEYVQWTFTAPDNDAIAGMPAECPIRYKVSYDFSAMTRVDVTVMNKDKLMAQYRAGKTPTITPVAQQATGPIKISISFGAQQPITGDSKLPVLITVEDKGTGTFSEFDASKLEIATTGGEIKIKDCQPTGVIPMIKKKSTQMRCMFIAPNPTDTQTFYITAKLDGSYSIDKAQKVSIKPTMTR